MTVNKNNLRQIIEIASKSSYLEDKKDSFMWLELIGLDQSLAQEIELLDVEAEEKLQLEVLDNINEICINILYHIVGVAVTMQLDYEKIFLDSFNEDIKNTVYNSAFIVLQYEREELDIDEYIPVLEGILTNYFIALVITVFNIGVNFDTLIEKDLRKIKEKLKNNK